MIPYNTAFYEKQDVGSLTSANAVIPILLNFLPFRSVVDFGCGRGTWLKACLEHGVQTILGLDGDYVDRDTLLIDRKDFRAVDLRGPIRLEREFDLAICLEVAEHLPARSARSFIESLTAAAPVVLFSAALPGQGGVSHINEQWPPYWEQFFGDRGFVKYDVIRPLIWKDRSIADYYRQNLYVFTKERHDNLDLMDSFEPDLQLLSTAVMGHATFRWSSRALRFMPAIRLVHSIFSRFA